jgi:hypothetical protein
MLAACSAEEDRAINAAADIAPAAGPAGLPAPAAAPQAAGAPVVAHLASYGRLADAMRGWAKLRLQYKDVFAPLEPRTVDTKVQGRHYTRLLAAGFADDEAARKFCEWAHSVRLYCVLVPLQGTPLKTI